MGVSRLSHTGQDSSPRPSSPVTSRPSSPLWGLELDLLLLPEVLLLLLVELLLLKLPLLRRRRSLRRRKMTIWDSDFSISFLHLILTNPLTMKLLVTLT